MVPAQFTRSFQPKKQPLRPLTVFIHGGLGLGFAQGFQISAGRVEISPAPRLATDELDIMARREAVAQPLCNIGSHAVAGLDQKNGPPQGSDPIGVEQQIHVPFVIADDQRPL